MYSQFPSNLPVLGFTEEKKHNYSLVILICFPPIMLPPFQPTTPNF